MATGARLAFVDGMDAALLISVGALLVVTLVLLVAIPGKQKPARSEPEDDVEIPSRPALTASVE